MLEAGVNERVVRLPQVHNTERQGMISPHIAIARDKSVAAYVEQGKAGQRHHAVVEEGVTPAPSPMVVNRPAGDSLGIACTRADAEPFRPVLDLRADGPARIQCADPRASWLAIDGRGSVGAGGVSNLDLDCADRIGLAPVITAKRLISALASPPA